VGNYSSNNYITLFVTQNSSCWTKSAVPWKCSSIKFCHRESCKKQL